MTDESGWIRWGFGLALSAYGIVLAVLYRALDKTVSKADLAKHQESCPIAIEVKNLVKSVDEFKADMKAWTSRIEKRMNKHFDNGEG